MAIKLKKGDKIPLGYCYECKELKKIVFDYKNHKFCLDCFKTSKKAFTLYLDWFFSNEEELEKFYNNELKEE